MDFCNIFRKKTPTVAKATSPPWGRLRIEASPWGSSSRRLVMGYLLLFIILLLSTTFAKNDVKLISLAPNITEIICFLGGEERLVGVTTDCDYPDIVRKKEKVGKYLFPDIEKIIALQPAVVIMEDTANAVFQKKLRGLKIDFYLYNFRELGSFTNELKEIAKEFDLPQDKKIAYLQIVYDDVKKEKEGNMIILIGQNPYMAAGGDTFISDFFEKMGFENIIKDEKYVKISNELFYREDLEFLINVSGRKIWLRNSKLRIVNDLNRDIYMRLSPRLILEYEKIYI